MSLGYFCYGDFSNENYLSPAFCYAVQESKINVGPRSIFCILEKAEKEWWKKILRGDAKTPHYVKVDWDKWVDEDEDTGSGDRFF